MQKIIILSAMLLLVSCSSLPADLVSSDSDVRGSIWEEDAADKLIQAEDAELEIQPGLQYIFKDEAIKKTLQLYLEKTADDFTKEDFDSLAKRTYLVVDGVVSSFEDISALFPKIKYLSLTIDNLSPKRYDLLKSIESLEALTIRCQSITVSDFENNFQYFEISNNGHDELSFDKQLLNFSVGDKDFIHRHMEGEVQKLVRIHDKVREYELINTNYYDVGEFYSTQERKVFVYDAESKICESVLDASYAVGSAWKNRLQLVDVNFDGDMDILVDNGHFGNQGFVTYTCFINYNGRYVKSDNFSEIWNPAIDIENKTVLGSWRNWAASHSYAMYTYESGEFVMTDRLTEEALPAPADGNNVEWQYIVESLVDGEFQEVERLYTKDFSKEEIFDMFFRETSFWGLLSNKWNTLYNMGKMSDFSIYGSGDINDTIYNIITGASESADPKHNPYFFPAFIREKEFFFESLTSHDFIGKATLKITELENTKINGYYELVFTDFKGICDGDKKFDDFACIAEEESLSLGYFFVDNENIYQMQDTKSFLDIFAEVEEFPPHDTYIENWNGKLKEAGENYGYFGYRLIFKESGFEDTFGTPESRDDRYHEFIKVLGNERQYYLYPITSGTQEHMYMYWEKGKGITYYANWAGALKDYVAFYDEEHKNKSLLIP